MCKFLTSGVYIFHLRLSRGCQTLIRTLILTRQGRMNVRVPTMSPPTRTSFHGSFSFSMFVSSSTPVLRPSKILARLNCPIVRDIFVVRDALSGTCARKERRRGERGEGRRSAAGEKKAKKNLFLPFILATSLASTSPPFQ